MEGSDQYKKIQDEVYEKMMRVEMSRAVAFFDSAIALCAIILIDGGIIKAVNKRFIQELGYEYTEIIGEPWMKFVWPEDLDSSIAEAREMQVDARGTIKYINRWRKKNGDPIIFQWKTQTDLQNGMYFCIIDILGPCVTAPDHICLCGMGKEQSCWRANNRSIGGLKLV
jgi:PAS domain S-box-containing protein